MKFFLQFLRQPVPKHGKEIPAYFRRALLASHGLLAVYFIACFFFFPLFSIPWQWFPLLLTAGAAAGLWTVRKGGLRLNLVFFSVLCFAWVWWNVYAFGWSSGVQHFLTLLLVFVFFDVYEKPVTKILSFAVLLAFRVLLFSYSQNHSEPLPLKNFPGAGTVYQTINTVAFFLMLAVVCIIFSSSIQDTERQLLLRNQTLYREAGTDPLTGLPNRRAMIETIEEFRRTSPDQFFCVAIADLDYFKTINDTYGHNCGDYTLVRLTELIVAHSAGQYRACRWGGEEFCLFMPGKNLDEARILMKDLCYAVEQMKLSFEEHDFSITMTIGVEENDYASPLEVLLNRADEKLYMGKEAGRNRVVA